MCGLLLRHWFLVFVVQCCAFCFECGAGGCDVGHKRLEGGFLHFYVILVIGVVHLQYFDLVVPADIDLSVQAGEFRLDRIEFLPMLSFEP